MKAKSKRSKRSSNKRLAERRILDASAAMPQEPIEYNRDLTAAGFGLVSEFPLTRMAAIEQSLIDDFEDGINRHVFGKRFAEEQAKKREKRRQNARIRESWDKR